MNSAVSTYSVAHYPCRVSAIVPLSLHTFQIDLEAPKGTNLSYRAGQYLQLELDLNQCGQPQVLSYSIANNFNPEYPHRLQLFIQNSSELTNKILEHLAVLNERKEAIKVTLPMGNAFLQTPLDSPHFLIASGSGISKIKCIAEEITRKNPDAKVNIYWSNKNIDDFYLLDTFQRWENTYRNLIFTPILDSAVMGWPGRSGYIYKVVKEDFEKLDKIKFYLCGSPQMVYGTIDKLKPIGLNEENCYSDVFEYAPRENKMPV